jgi:large subunit ribosomal protein L31
MKPDTHPNYVPVVFRDAEADFSFLTRSTATSTKTIEWEDGNTYPVIDVDVSSKSHPFYTGKRRLMDTGGRLGRFQAKLEALEGSEAPSPKKKKASVRINAPAVDPKALAAKAARAEAKALEDAKKKAEAEEAEKRAAEEAKAAKEQAEAEAKAAEAAAAEAPAEDAPADEAPAAEAEAPAAEETPAEEAPAESADEA